MKYVIIYITTFLIVYIVYYLFVVKRKKAQDKIKKSLEVRYLINRYHIDIEKVDMHILIKKMSLCNSLIISTTFMTILIVENFILKMLLGFAVLFPLILVGYHLLAKSLIKKEGK